MLMVAVEVVSVVERKFSPDFRKPFESDVIDGVGCARGG